MKTDKEVLELTIGWFEKGAKDASKLQTGNLAHDRVHMQGFLGHCAEYIRDHLRNQIEGC